MGMIFYIHRRLEGFCCEETSLHSVKEEDVLINIVRKLFNLLIMLEPCVKTDEIVICGYLKIEQKPYRRRKANLALLPLY